MVDLAESEKDGRVVVWYGSQQVVNDIKSKLHAVLPDVPIFVGAGDSTETYLPWIEILLKYGSAIAVANKIWKSTAEPLLKAFSEDAGHASFKKLQDLWTQVADREPIDAIASTLTGNINVLVLGVDSPRDLLNGCGVVIQSGQELSVEDQILSCFAMLDGISKAFSLDICDHVASGKLAIVELENGGFVITFFNCHTSAQEQRHFDWQGNPLDR